MDVPGKADALGLGWVYMAPKRVVRGLFRRQEVVAVSLPIGDDPAEEYWRVCGGHSFAVERFKNMSDGINDLVTELSGNNRWLSPHPD